MKGRFIQKVCLHGSSTLITIVRPVMFALGLRPGDFVEVTLHEDGYLIVRPWHNHDTDGQRAIGRLPDATPAGPR